MNRGLNGTLVRTVLAAALGGSLLGFDTAVVSGATYSLTRVFALSPPKLGITVSIALWGTVVGAMTAGALGRRLGGRGSLLILGTCYLVSALGCALSQSWSSLLLFRFIGGLGMGGSSVIAPVYIAEIAPPAWRGRLVGTFQVNIIAGILLAYLSNYLVGLALLGDLEWRWQFGVAVAPAALFLLMLVGIPPSARWLAMRGRLAEAKAVLLKLGAPHPEAELAEIIGALGTDVGPKADSLFQWKYRRPILFAVALAVFNQLVGINAVLYYLNDIFAMAGFDRTTQNWQAVAVAGVMLTTTLVALTLIDRFGRRTLLLVGSVGLVVCLAGISAIFRLHAHQGALLILVMAYVGFFTFSQGTVIWVYLSEIFPSRVRAQGQSLGCSTHWIMNGLLSAVFPSIAVRSPSAPFALFCVVAMLQFVVVLLIFPETSGVALEDMQRRMGISKDESDSLATRA